MSMRDASRLLLMFFTLIVACFILSRESSRRSNPDHACSRFPQGPNSATKLMATSDGFELQISAARPLRITGKAVTLTFPQSFAGAVHVRSGNAEVLALPLAAHDAPGHIAAGGDLVYPDAFDDCDVSYHCDALKTEEFLTIKGPKGCTQWSWELQTGGLTPRLTAMHTIELLDNDKVPRLRIDAPEGEDAVGKRLRVNEGLTLTLNGSRITLSADVRGCKFPVTIDPSWSSTGTMAATRYKFLLVKLNDGTVLAIGDGQGGKSCEVFDPVQGTWAAVGSTVGVRDNTSTATLLPQSGKVLVVGGQSAPTTAELYDPVSMSWSATANPPQASHINDTATAFGNNDHVLLACSSAPPTITAEIFNGVDTFSPTPTQMAVNRVGAAAVLLGDGTSVLVAGGVNSGTLNTCEIFDTSTGNWTSVASQMSSGRALHSMVLLDTNSVLAVGGGSSTADLFNPVTNTWSATGNPVSARSLANIIPFSGGAHVLVAGGAVFGVSSASCEVFSSSTGNFGNTVSMSQARDAAAAVLLNNGRVLVAGGRQLSGPTLFKTCEIFDPLPAPQSQSVSLRQNRSLPINLQAAVVGTPAFAITAGPSNGNLTGTLPNVTYTPNPNFNGADSFTYSVTDSVGTNSATVSITVVANTAPVLDTNGQFSLDDILENTPVSSNPGTLVSSLLASAGGPYSPPPEVFFAPAASVLQSDGKLVVGGTNTTGLQKSNVARINLDGSLDSGFAAKTGSGIAAEGGGIVAMALQADGKIVIAGAFSTFNNQSVPKNILRLNADGSLDTNFCTNVGSGFTQIQLGAFSEVFSLAIQSDGKILVGGEFTLANGQPHSNIARLNPDGSVDGTYNTSVLASSAGILAMALQADGKAIIGGFTSIVNGTARNILARINLDGTLDAAYNPSGLSQPVTALAIQSDGKTVAGNGFGGVSRFNTDGSLDFSAGTGSNLGDSISAIAFQSDGKIVIGGTFTSFSSSNANNIVRLNTDGSLDVSFNPLSGANGAINTLEIQPDGKILAAGALTKFNGNPCNHVVRILSGGGADNSRIFDPDDAVQGIAVIAADNTNGTWQFSTDGITFTNLNALSISSATLLASDVLTRVRFLPNPDFFGTVSTGLTFRAWDQTLGTNAQQGVDTSTNGGTTAFSSATAPAEITVDLINRPPTFTIGSNITTTEAKVVNTFPNFITGFNPGLPSENAQTVLRYIVTNDNTPVNGANVFTAQPAIDNSGVLTFTPANNIDFVTVVTVTVAVQDNGGALNGGNDTSVPQTFKITLTPVADTLIVSNTFDAGPNSLRDCMVRARNGDTITFDPDVFDLTNAQSATVINLQSALPDMDHGGVTIDASDRRVTLNGTGAGQCNGFTISSANNTIRGLSIVGFTNAGVALKGSGATGNLVGGDRSVGSGSNGQGLRISGSGAFGINVDQGACNNTIKGCWVGLDTSGTASEPNLAGIVVQGGACNNTIGSASPGEANAISGNTFEGITVTGAGTDNNVIIGNLVGVSAQATPSGAREAAVSRDSITDLISGRTSVQNGASGVFLSRGTKNSTIGGNAADDDATLVSKSNIIGFNVGNGIEVRALTSKQNASRGNRISQNKGGGIGLFNGSNGGILRPSFSAVETIPGRSGTFADGRAVPFSVHVKGAATNGDGTPGNGVVELFSDPSDQGQVPIGRTAVSNGLFDVTVDVSDLTLSLNATYTDAAGNTSPFLVSGPPPTASTLPADLTNNLLNTLIGVNPSDSSSAATGTGTLTASKFTAVLNFLKKSQDALQATMAIKLPDGFSNSGTVVVVVYDQNSAKASLDSKGKGASEGVAVKLMHGKLGGISTLQMSIRNRDLVAGFVNSGLISKTTPKSGETHSVPIAIGMITAAGEKFVYSGSVDVTYRATDKKNGKGIRK